MLESTSGTFALARHALAATWHHRGPIYGWSTLFHAPLIVYAGLVLVGAINWNVGVGVALTLAGEFLLIPIFAGTLQYALLAEQRGGVFDLRLAGRTVDWETRLRIVRVSIGRIPRCFVWILIPFAGLWFSIARYARSTIAIPIAVCEPDEDDVYGRTGELAGPIGVTLIRLMMLVGVTPLVIQLAIELLAQGGSIALAVPRVASVVIAIAVAPISAAAYGLAYDDLRADLAPSIDSAVVKVFE